MLGKPAWIALTTLSLLNLLNYADRYVIGSLLPFLQKPETEGGLAITDSQGGWLYSAFILVYIAVAPIFGVLADRGRRLHLLAIAVALWSILTGAGAWAVGFWSLLIIRSLTGVGEAAYASVAPAVLADEFPPSLRSRVMALFNAAIPVGAAIGFSLGSLIGVRYGWRTAFLFAGVPGLILAATIYLLRDPPRGGMDSKPCNHTLPNMLSAIQLIGHVRWSLCVLGYALQTACFGSLGFWAPSYLQKIKGVSAEESGTIFGAIVVITGLFGTLAGGWWSDRWFKTDPAAHLKVCAITSFIAAPLILAVVFINNPYVLWPTIGAALFMLVMSVGPVNAQLVNVLDASERATGMAMAILGLHLLGDVPAVPIFGWISQQYSMNFAFGLLPIFALLCGAVWWYAARNEPPRVRDSALV